MTRVIFFDIDNTLYDSTTLAGMARRNSVKSMIDAGLGMEDEERVYNSLREVIEDYGSNYPYHYDRLLDKLDIEWNPRIVAAGVVAYEHTKLGYLKPFPGVVPALLELRRKYRLGIISNGKAVKQWEKLIGLGIHHFFDAVVTSEEVGAEKPGEGIFLQAAEKLGAKPEACLMVGDRVDMDIAGANAVGMNTLWIKKGHYSQFEPRSSEEEPHYEAESYFEIASLIGAIL